MKPEEFIQPFLIFSLVAFLFAQFFFVIPKENSEFVKTCLTAIISFVSGSSIALALVRASKEDKKK